MCIHTGIPRNTKPEAVIHIPKRSNVKKKRQNELLTKYYETKNPQECSFSADHLLLGMEPTFKGALYFQWTQSEKKTHKFFICVSL